MKIGKQVGINNYKSVFSNVLGDEEFARAVFDSLPQGIFIIDAGGRCIYANPACIKMLGYAGTKELIGKNLWSLIHKINSGDSTLSEKVKHNGQRFLSGKRFFGQNDVLFRRDGSKFMAECWSYPVKRDGKLVGNLIIFTETGPLSAAGQLTELARIPDINPGPVLQLDLQGNVIMSNSAARRLFGDKLGSFCWQDICPGIDTRMWNDILNAKVPKSVERVIGSKTFIFSYNPDSESGQVYVFGTDITEKKRAEKALQQTDQLVRLLLNSTVEGIYGMDLDGNCTFANAACLKMLGFGSVEELQSDQMYRLVHRTGPDGVKRDFKGSRIYRALMREEAVHVNDEMMYRKDNSGFPVEYWAYPVRQEGKLIGCVVTFMDATNRRKIEQLQSDYTAALAEVARFPEMNPGPVLRLDKNGKVLMANKAAHNVFEKPVNQLWKNICPDIDEKTWNSIIKRRSVVLERHIGNQYYIFTHRRDLEGNSVFVFGANITEQKQVEWALLQTEKMASLGKLSAGLAHELNNPASAAGRAGDQLSGILDALQSAIIEITKCKMDPDLWDRIAGSVNEFRRRAIQAGNLSPLEISDREEEIQNWLERHGIQNSWEIASTMVKFYVDKKDLDAISALVSQDALSVVINWLCRILTAYDLTGSIVSSTHNIASLVNVVKSYSHMGSAPEKYVDIHTGLDDTLAILTNQLKEGVKIIRDYDQNLPQIQVQGSELNQVWTSIIDNAIFAMNGKGKLVIRTFRNGKWLVVQIEDSGPGIAQDIQPKIFDPFFTTKAPGEGAGLGLNISHNIIVHKHKGKLSVKSVPGHTCFEIRLPLKKRTAAKS